METPAQNQVVDDDELMFDYLSDPIETNIELRDAAPCILTSHKHDRSVRKVTSYMKGTRPKRSGRLSFSDKKSIFEITTFRGDHFVLAEGEPIDSDGYLCKSIEDGRGEVSKRFKGKNLASGSHSVPVTTRNARTPLLSPLILSEMSTVPFALH